MRSGIIAVLSVLCCVCGLQGQDEPSDTVPLPRPKVDEKIILDVWDAAFLQGARAGYVRTVVREVEQNGQKLLHTIKILNLNVRRFQEVIPLRMDTGTIETTDGKVVGVFMRQYSGARQLLAITGRVEGQELHLVQDGTKKLKAAPWNDQVLGLFRQFYLLKDRDVKPGETFSFLSFEPTINLVLKGNVQVKDVEKVEMLGGKVRRELLRVEVTPEKIDGTDLPPINYWLDQQKIPVRAETKMAGLGTLVLYRTSKEEALAPAEAVKLVDVGLDQMVPLKRRIPDPYGTRSAIYHITVKDDKEPTTAFSRDERQTPGKVQGSSFELRVQAVTAPVQEIGSKRPGPEFLESSYFINCNDSLVRKLARVAVSSEKDPWQKALRIETWIFKNMRNQTHETLAPADHVARTLNGDCTEYAMLMAAMCRAEGVPAKTAVGLIYADTPLGPRFAFHMWTEVWVRGQWVALDATLGRGYVGATHLRVLDPSWHDTYSLTPLLRLTRVVGRLSIELVETR